MRLRVLGIVLAGGKGTRLYPLTKERAKPAVPFGGKYRIIDFVLSNFINAGIHSIYVLTQCKSQSLLQHLAATAVERGYARVEWSVLDWNEPSINFYKKLGASPMDEWSTFRLTGEALEAFGARQVQARG